MMNVLDKDLQQLLASDLEFNKFKDTNFLITGATGLIGSLLIKSILFLNNEKDLNVKVYAIVRNLEKAKGVFGELYNNERLAFITANLNIDSIDVKDKIDYIVHAAAVTRSKILVEKPVEAMETAINGTKKMLEVAKRDRVRKMVYISSMEIYGKVDSSKKAAELDLGYVDLTNVRSGYPESKRMCELMCNAYASEYRVNVTSARLAQTFGAGILPNENRVFAQFAKSAIDDRDIVLHTEGISEGNYVYTMDAIEAILLLLLKGKNGEAYNVSNPNNHITIKGMAELVAQNFSKDSKVIIDIPDDSKKYGYAPETHLWLDATKLESLGWNPKNNLTESYAKLIEWIRENR